MPNFSDEVALPTLVPGEYTTGVSDHRCEITPEMMAICEANSRALEEMIASPFDVSIPVRYRVGDIDASQV